MPAKVTPYGTWPSPITPEMLVEAAVRLGHATVAGDRVYWIESRPSEAGREVIVACPIEGGEPSDVIPPGFSARTQVHEYGGRCFAVHPTEAGRVVVFSNWADQRLWVVDPGTADRPEPLTPEPPADRADRYADPEITPDGRWVVCVRERHRSGQPVENDLVAVSLEPAAAPEPVVLAAGHDFYSFPRISPDGTRLAWISWDLPDMPWDSTELWVATGDTTTTDGRIDLKPAAKVAGGPGESVTQPRWSPDGVLHYVSDCSGWWNLYHESGLALCPMAAEFAEPDWAFGNSSYGFAPDGTLVATWSEAGRGQIGPIDKQSRAHAWAFDFTHYSSVHPIDGGAVAIAGSATQAPAVVRLEPGDGQQPVTVLRRSRQMTIDEAHLSRPEPVEFPTGSGAVTAHALLYPPTHAELRGPDDEQPPVLVIIHGGPTSSATPVLNLATQYWTNRGFAVADVDYRGSSGYGRAYRQLLHLAWGVADVEDCASVVRWLDAQGRADGRRAVIRGGSAGGFTTLAALAFTDVFAAGASLYGLTDLALIARTTHKFESGYMDGLVGPWPEAAAEYERRSPLYHVDRINRPVILFQGLEDKVVPPEQSELMFHSLEARGVPVAYLAFEGEQHGFRQAETVIRVMSAELEFYGRALGLEPAAAPTSSAAGSRPPLEILNDDRISPPA